eukprot:gene24927-biopygen17957
MTFLFIMVQVSISIPDSAWSHNHGPNCWWADISIANGWKMHVGDVGDGGGGGSDGGGGDGGDGRWWCQGHGLRENGMDWDGMWWIYGEWEDWKLWEGGMEIMQIGGDWNGIEAYWDGAR